MEILVLITLVIILFCAWSWDRAVRNEEEEE